ncbi:MAG: hypothetical protein IJF83_10980 [Methanobrevibacter sp.]|nr:hypothetical protein [Methanobrevibacter sp.]
MKWKTIVSTSEKIKKQIEKDKTLPRISGYNNGELLYILAKAVQTPNKDITDKEVENAPDPSGNNIHNNLTRNEYQKLAKSTVKWIDDKDTAPNYTMYQKYNVSVKLQLYCYSKIIVFYHEHSNTLPLTCWFKYSDVANTQSNQSNNKKNTNTPTSSNKKYGRSTKTSCDNRGQNTGYYCACHMAQEIIRNLTGIVVPQSKIASIMGTTTAGTSHNGINTFFAWFNKTYNRNLQIEWKNFSEVGWNGLKKILESNNQDAGEHECYRDTWGHYTNFDKIYDNSVDVHNSLGSMCTSTCYCGYEENRSKSTAQRYLNGISQKSILIVTRK